MFGERSKKDHDNYVNRMLNSEDTKIKADTYNSEVQTELENEMAKFLNYQRGLKV